MTGFSALHRAGAPLLLPNAWDYASGAVLAQAGFAAVGTTSLGVAAAAGKPDAAGATRAETLALAAALVRLPVPVTVDIEGGFGDTPEQVAGLAAELAGLGIAGVNLEDGRPDGTLGDLARQADLISAIKERAPELFVNARTDAYWLERPEPLDEALRRVAVFAQAGADGVFVPGIAAEDDIAAAVAAVPLPLNVLLGPGGHSVARLAELGVRRVSLGSLLYRAALHAAVQTARAVATGEVPGGLPTYGDVVALLPGAGHEGPGT